MIFQNQNNNNNKKLSRSYNYKKNLINYNFKGIN